MDHKTAERTMAVEKYLLDEFSPTEKDDFEEHFFSCEECALELKLGAAFMAHAKESLKAVPAVVPATVPIRPQKRAWFRWFSPAFALPAMAFMLGLGVFQNLVQLPELHRSLNALNSPEVLTSADLKSGGSRGGESVVLVKAGALFQLTIDIPDTSNVAHIAELYDASGRKLWTVAVPEDAPKDGLALKMPGDLPAGRYSLVVKQAGAAESGGSSQYKFILQRQ
jgi:hypothetical protein